MKYIPICENNYYSFVKFYKGIFCIQWEKYWYVCIFKLTNTFLSRSVNFCADAHFQLWYVLILTNVWVTSEYMIHSVSENGSNDLYDSSFYQILQSGVVIKKFSTQCFRNYETVLPCVRFKHIEKCRC